MQVDLFLTCGCRITVPVESVLVLPKIGEEIKCKIHQKVAIVERVGTPYRIEHIDTSNDDNQQSLLK